MKRGMVMVGVLLWLGGPAVGVAAVPDSPEALIEEVARAAQQSRVVRANKDAKENNAPVRRRALEEAAQVYGIQSGRLARWQWLLKAVSARARTLDRAFPFQALLLRGGKLQPPVLDAGSDISRIREDGRRLTQVRRMYRVKVPARFVHTPLSWRDFLQPESLDRPEFPRESLLPRNEAELALWAEVLRRSWNDGVRVADEEFRMRVAALESAFSGMVLYDMLALRGMIEPPEIAEVDHGPAEVGGHGSQLAVGGHEEVVKRDAYFVGDVNQWKPVDLRLPAGLED